MKIEVISKQRKDGKFKVKTMYQGAPNMFGGRDHGQSFTTLKTAAQIIDLIEHSTFEGGINIEQFKTTTTATEV
tara:strand:- start:950 stop:1171 length:222 start_codon:yes stop_codon:yes gene_type:complete